MALEHADRSTRLESELGEARLVGWSRRGRSPSGWVKTRWSRTPYGSDPSVPVGMVDLHGGTRMVDFDTVNQSHQDWLRPSR